MKQNDFIIVSYKDLVIDEPCLPEKLVSVFKSSIVNIDESLYDTQQKMAWIGNDGLNDGIDVWALRFYTTNPTIAIDDTRQVLGFIEHYSKVEEGYIDCFYVSPDFQKIGVGQSLYLYAMQQLVEDCKVIQVYASKVAKPFFIKQGFCVVSENTVIKNGVKLDNWLMTLNSAIIVKS